MEPSIAFSLFEFGSEGVGSGFSFPVGFLVLPQLIQFHKFLEKISKIFKNKILKKFQKKNLKKILKFFFFFKKIFNIKSVWCITKFMCVCWNVKNTFETCKIRNLEFVKQSLNLEIETYSSQKW